MCFITFVYDLGELIIIGYSGKFCWFADFDDIFGLVADINPILTGGGGQFDPLYEIRDCLATRLFMSFFFQVLRIF